MNDKREAVRERYARAARGAGCCGPASEAELCHSPRHYSDTELAEIPSSAAGLSLGCANPISLAGLHEGEIVLDLGSGGGLDALLAARSVGRLGKVYGLDMTDEMLGVARDNQKRARLDNVEFLKGFIEAIPLPDNAVDVVISNCVINLSVDKQRVFAESFRVLRPGGRFAIADIVCAEELDGEHQGDLTAWSSCITGAITRDRYRAGLESAGFRTIALRESHEVAPGFASVLVTAIKPPVL